MKIYNYDAETKEYLNESDATESPLQPDTYLIPANATTVKPMNVKDGNIAIFNVQTQKWSSKEDHRGKTVYEVATADSLVVDYIGKIPNNYTFDEPKELQVWTDDGWKFDLEMMKSDAHYRLTRIRSGIKYDVIFEEMFNEIFTYEVNEQSLDECPLLSFEVDENGRNIDELIKELILMKDEKIMKYKLILQMQRNIDGIEETDDLLMILEEIEKMENENGQ